ncbi:MAG: carboxypeptidase-like regulatory domain-containing protein [Jejuia sp.]
MNLKILSLIVFVCITNLVCGQTISGKIIDATTKQPLEAVAIYFDNTTKGTTTNNKGEFSFSYTNAIQSPLVITYLGYKKQLITDYRNPKFLNIQLEESHESLDEVVINANDGLTRKEKLKVFRREFLGTSGFGTSCTILNEEAVILKYLKKENRLIAYSYEPLKIENVALQYLITYDLSSFSAKFAHANPKTNNFEVNEAGFQGNPYYQDMPVFNRQKAIRNRARAYRGSTLQFMRALYAGNLEEEKFKIHVNRTSVPIHQVFEIELFDNGIKKINLKKNDFSISYRNKQFSQTQVRSPYFLVDIYGNYNKVSKIIFSGYIGSRRFGDLLPFDYGL